MSNIISVDLRETDLLGRVGGDEFAVLVPETDLQGACEVADRFRLSAAGQRASDSQKVVPYTLSLGVATLEPEDTSMHMAFQRADNALYASKHDGRNCVMAEDGLRAHCDAYGR